MLGIQKLWQRQRQNTEIRKIAKNNNSNNYNNLSALAFSTLCHENIKIMLTITL